MTHTIHTNELRRLRTAHSDLLLIDVMPKATFDKDHIHGARNIPVDSADFVAAVGRVAGRKDRKIVVYCAGERCDASKRAAAKLVPPAIAIGVAVAPRVMVKVPAPILLASVMAPAAVESDCAAARVMTSML